jgi:hypothetical protein
MRFSLSLVSVLLLSTSAFAAPNAEAGNGNAAGKVLSRTPGPGQNILAKIETMWPKLQTLLDDMGYINNEAQQIPGSYPKKQQILDDITPWWEANGYLFDLLGKLKVDVEKFTQTKSSGFA